MADRVADIVKQLEAEPAKVRQAVLAELRKHHPIHPIEGDWGVPAEVILEAIARSSDLSQRGVRGLIAEAYFETHVLPSLAQWRDSSPPAGDVAYDFAVTDGQREVRIQVKTQRRKAGRAMMANEAYRRLSGELYAVETQKTRAGKSNDGGDTRPYRFGDFDLLAVNMEPATGDWTQFRYTLAQWLLPREEDPGQIL